MICLLCHICLAPQPPDLMAAICGQSFTFFFLLGDCLFT